MKGYDFLFCGIGIIIIAILMIFFGMTNVLLIAIFVVLLFINDNLSQRKPKVKE